MASRHLDHLSVLVVPFVLGVGAAWIQDRIFNPSDLFVKGKVSQWLSNVVEPPIAPTVWDWLFTADRFPESGFLVMRFQDGTQVGGAFAKMSMALTSPEAQGVFLEREWNLDDSGNVLTEVTGTAGILIPKVDTVRWVRILRAEALLERSLMKRKTVPSPLDRRGKIKKGVAVGRGGRPTTPPPGQGTGSASPEQPPGSPMPTGENEPAGKDNRG